jgi:hypothetical protein
MVRRRQVGMVNRHSAALLASILRTRHLSIMWAWRSVELRRLGQTKLLLGYVCSNIGETVIEMLDFQ